MPTPAVAARKSVVTSPGSTNAVSKSGCGPARVIAGAPRLRRRLARRGAGAACRADGNFKRCQQYADSGGWAESRFAENAARRQFAEIGPLGPLSSLSQRLTARQVLAAAWSGCREQIYHQRSCAVAERAQSKVAKAPAASAALSNI